MGAAYAGLVVAIILIALSAARMRAGYQKTLEQLGRPLGLSYQRLGATIGSGHALRGWVDGRVFELLVVPEGRVLRERWSIQLAGMLPGGFSAGKNGLLRGASAGTTRLASGDPELDRCVLAEGRDPQQAWQVLAAEPRRAALKDLAAMNAVVFDNKVMFGKHGFDNNLRKLTARLDRLRAIAAALDPVQPPAPQVPQPMAPA